MFGQFIGRVKHNLKAVVAGITGIAVVQHKIQGILIGHRFKGNGIVIYYLTIGQRASDGHLQAVGQVGAKVAHAQGQCQRISSRGDAKFGKTHCLYIIFIKLIVRYFRTKQPDSRVPLQAHLLYLCQVKIAGVRPCIVQYTMPYLLDDLTD